MSDSGDMKRIGGLWVSEKNGRRYLSGKIDERVVIEPGYRLFIFPAKEKRSERSPSHYVCIAPPQSQSSGQDEEAF